MLIIRETSVVVDEKFYRSTKRWGVRTTDIGTKKANFKNYGMQAENVKATSFLFTALTMRGQVVEVVGRTET